MTKKAKKKPKKNAAPGSMTTKQYLAALEELGLTVAGKRTAEALGLGLRQCQRISVGKAPVPGPVEKLLALYLKYGFDEED